VRLVGGLALGCSWERATVLLQVASAIVQKALTGECVLSSICYFLNVYFCMGIKLLVAQCSSQYFYAKKPNFRRFLEFQGHGLVEIHHRFYHRQSKGYNTFSSAASASL